jgi:hypothetical protein
MSASEEDDEKVEAHRRAMIQQYCLLMASSLPQMFAHCLTSEHIDQCLGILVKPAYYNKDEQATFKLFSMILSLQKLKLAGATKKGFSQHGDLWLFEINKVVSKLLKSRDTADVGEESDLIKHHRKVLKYVRKNVSTLREELFARFSNETNTEKKLSLEREAKKALAIEKLFYSLALMSTLPSQDLD